jgi:hypothetical protein
MVRERRDNGSVNEEWVLYVDVIVCRYATKGKGVFWIGSDLRNRERGKEDVTRAVLRSCACV